MTNYQQFAKNVQTYLQWYENDNLLEGLINEIFHFHLTPGIEEFVNKYPEFISFDRLLIFQENDLASGKYLRTLIVLSDEKVLLLRRKRTYLMANLRVNYEIEVGTTDDLILNFARYDKTGMFSDKLKHSYYSGSYQFKGIKPYSNDIVIDVFTYERFINNMTHPWWGDKPTEV
jgi:hypothetical protein